MALFRDDGGKTEQPTPGRLGEVRNRGDTHLSREFLMAGVLLVAVIALRWLGAWLLDSFAAALTFGLRVDPAAHPSADASVPGVMREILTFVALVAPPFLSLLGVLIAATLALGYGQIGFRISNEALTIKLERLNPVANFSRLFHPQALVRTGFSVLKLAVLGLVL